MRLRIKASGLGPDRVRGAGGFTPNRTRDVREATKTFPDADSVSMLRELGV